MCQELAVDILCFNRITDTIMINLKIYLNLIDTYIYIYIYNY